MKKRISIIIAIILLLGGSAYYGYYKTKSVAASSKPKQNMRNGKMMNVSSENNFPVYYDMPADKVWNISFPEPVDETSVTGQNLHVFDEDRNTVNSEVKLSNNNQTITIRPPKEGYTKGNYYELQMCNKLAYPDGQSVSKSFKLGFFIARDKVKNIVFNKKIRTIDKQAIVSDKHDQLTLKTHEIEQNLKIGDILRLPTNDEIYKEKAVKIVQIEEGQKVIHISYEQPKFEELFDMFDLYNTYKLTDPMPRLSLPKAST